VNANKTELEKLLMHWRRRDKDLFFPASDERNFPDIKLPVNKSQRVGLVYDPFLEFQWIVIRIFKRIGIKNVNDRNPCVFLYICTLNVGVYTREHCDVATLRYSDNYYLTAIPLYCPN